MNRTESREPSAFIYLLRAARMQRKQEPPKTGIDAVARIAMARDTVRKLASGLRRADGVV